MQQEIVIIEYPKPIYDVIKTSYDGLPSVLVVNKALLEFKHKDIFPWHLVVIIAARDFAENGMPTHDEAQILDKVGGEIDTGITGDKNALFLARETWNGTRQLFFQVHDPEVADKFLHKLITRGDPKREWEYQMEYDATWEYAEVFLSLLSHESKQ